MIQDSGGEKRELGSEPSSSFALTEGSRTSSGVEGVESGHSVPGSKTKFCYIGLKCASF